MIRFTQMEKIPGERNKQAYTQNALFQLKNLIL
jgi:hypothetical protein